MNEDPPKTTKPIEGGGTSPEERLVYLSRMDQNRPEIQEAIRSAQAEIDKRKQFEQLDADEENIGRSNDEDLAREYGDKDPDSAAGEEPEGGAKDGAKDGKSPGGKQFVKINMLDKNDPRRKGAEGGMKRAGRAVARAIAAPFKFAGDVAEEILEDELEANTKTSKKKNVKASKSGAPKINLLNNKLDKSKGKKEKEKEKEEVAEEIERIAPQDRVKIGWGLRTLGFKVERAKNDFFAKSLDYALEKTKAKKSSGVARFCRELRDSFVRDANSADKKAAGVINDKEKRKLSNAGFLFGNIFKYGRMITDLTGKSLASPLRYVMMSAMAVARMSEAGKEAVLKDEEYVDKELRIQDVDKAAEEAWRIHEQAQKRAGQGKGVTKEDLNKAYLAEMPKDLQERLKIPANGNSFMQAVIKKDIEGAVGRLNKKIEDIETNGNLSPEQKEAAKEKLLDDTMLGWQRDLKDYDRIITQYGTVNAVAMGARYMQTAGKALVAGLAVETAVLSVQKMFEAVSNIIHNHGVSVETDEVKRAAEKIGQKGKIDKSGIKVPKTADRPTVTDAKSVPDASVKPEVAPTPDTPPTTEQLGPLDPDAIVGKGQGIEHAFIKQIMKNRELAEKLGWNGKQDLREFANWRAHRLSLEHGYVDQQTGEEVWIKGDGGDVAYEIKIDPNGKPAIYERLADGTLKEMRTAGGKFEVAQDKLEDYEYKHGRFQRPTAPLDSQPQAPASETMPELKEEIREYLDTAIKPSVSETISNSDTLKDSVSDAAASQSTGMTQEKIETIREQVLNKMTTGQEMRTGGVQDPSVRITGHGTGGDNYEFGPRDPNLGRGVYRSGVMSEQHRILANHEAFARNPYHLSEDKLLKTYEFGKGHVKVMFGHEQSLAWNNLRKASAIDLLNYTDEDPTTATKTDLFAGYLRALRKFSEVGEPKRVGLLRRSETAEQYMARALQKLANEGKLDAFEAKLKEGAK